MKYFAPILVGLLFSSASKIIPLLCLLYFGFILCKDNGQDNTIEI